MNNLYFCCNPLLIFCQTMPSGTRGLLFSTILAALVTSLTSVFHSTATIFTLDLWGRFRRHASIPELMVMGRLCILLLIAICIMWLPVVREVHIVTGEKAP